MLGVTCLVVDVVSITGTIYPKTQVSWSHMFR